MRIPRARLEIDGRRGGLVDQVMAIAGALYGAIGRKYYGLTAVFDEREFASVGIRTGEFNAD